MAKKIKIRIMPDGRVRADIDGFVGPECLNYVKVLEEILEAKTVKTELKPEYHLRGGAEIHRQQRQEIHLKNNKREKGV